MSITPSEMYKKLKSDLDNIPQAIEDYKRLQYLIYLSFAIFFLLGFAIGFILKARYL
jgi:hypothetical protein